MPKLRYALIGCGRRGAFHLQTVSEMKDTFDVAAVCDANPESARRAGDSLGVQAYTNLSEMVMKEKLDVCDIVVPNELHHAVSMVVSAHGIHQNVETPLAPTLGLMDAMIATAARHGVKLQTSENFPFMPVEQFVVKLLRAGVIGRVHKCYRLFSTTGYHGLAAICCRMGARPVAVSSLAHSMPVVPYVDPAGRDFRSEELEFYAVDFEGGGIAVAVCGNKNGCLGRNQLVGFETCGERGTIVTNGNQSASGGETVNVCTDEDIARRAGRAATYEFHREFTSGNTLRRLWVELPDSLGGNREWTNPYAHTRLSEVHLSVAFMLDGLARAVREDGPLPWPGEKGRADQEMCLAARRSIQRSRQPVPLPLAPDPAEEEAFARQFEERFGIHPLDEPENVVRVSFKAR
ncbi:MAG: Gfo/Idh/MocA family oxidoreductase [Planctomycetes bacterium]|nr:Gfo/Idh/MocA family oxidoreductase [Planctomycetota bacterium]